MDFVAGVGFRYFARGFRLLAGPLTTYPYIVNVVTQAICTL